MVNKNYPLHKEDIDYLEKAIINYEVSIQKGITMCGNFNSSREIYKKELEDYIAKLFDLYELYDQLYQRKSMQD